MSNEMIKFWFCIVAFVMLPAGMRAQGDDHNFSVAKNMEMFAEVYRNLDMLYVDTLDANKVIGTGINAMLRSLDRYTEYYPAEASNALKYPLTAPSPRLAATLS